jgi:hypothetical protein
MKKYVKYFAALFILFVLCYLSTSFINANFDFTKWDQESRLGMIFVWSLLCGVSIMPLSLMEED